MNTAPRNPATDGPQVPGIRFPDTSWTLLELARGEDEAAKVALAEFIRRYHRPVHAYLAAIVHDPVQAEDLTQEFFARVVLTGRLLAHVDRARGRLRPYLKQALRHFVTDWHRKRVREPRPDVEPDAKSGGWDAYPAEDPGPDAAFHTAWVQALLETVLNQVRTICEAKGQQQHLELFLGRYLSESVEPPSWKVLGRAYGLDEKTARTRAETVARHFRMVLQTLLIDETGSERAANEEINILQWLL
jgi:RNA polymerase sigma factor (sigma-70 family)